MDILFFTRKKHIYKCWISSATVWSSKPSFVTLYPSFVPTQHHWKIFGSSTLGLSGERMSTVLSEKTRREINVDKTSFLPMYMVTTKNVQSKYVKSTRQNMFQKTSWGSPNDSVACYQPRWQGIRPGMLDALIPKPNICLTQTHDSTRDRCSIPWWNPKIFVHPRFCTPRHTNDCENYNCYVNQEENHLGVQHATNPKKVPTILTLPLSLSLHHHPAGPARLKVRKHSHKCQG